MGQIINPKWAADIQEQLTQDRFVDFTGGFAPAIRWLIVELTKRNKQFRVVNLGAGEKKVILEDCACPFCNGTGRNKETRERRKQ